jgi:SSS family solute:Na+ symporter
MMAFATGELGGAPPLVSGMPAQEAGNNPVGSTMVLLPLLVLWYGCCDQSVVQRVLSARGDSDLQKGIAGTAVLKGLVIVGVLMLAPHLLRVQPSPASGAAEMSAFGSSSPGVRGLLLVGGLSLLMATFSGTYQSVSALASAEFLPWVRRGRSEERVILIGRLSAALVTVLTVVAITLLRSMTLDTLAWLLLVHVLAMIPMMVILLGGLVCRRVNRLGALAALVGPLGTAVVFFVVRAISLSPGEARVAVLTVSDVVVLIAAVAGMSVVTLAAASLLTAAPSEQHTCGLTLSGRLPVRSAV